MYATANQMRDRYGEKLLVQLVDAEGWDALAIARIEEKTRSASTRADGYVAKYYSAASGSRVPPLLTELVMDIAFADLDRAPTEEAAKVRDRAYKMLGQIAAGLVKLDQGEVGALPGRDGQVIVPEAERTFSRDRLKGF